MCNKIMRHFLRGGGGRILRRKFSLSPPQAAVLLRLLEFNDPEFGCYPTEQTIADWTAMSVKTVEKAIAALKGKGCFHCVKKAYRDSRGRERSGQGNHYVFSEEVDRLVEECAAIGQQRARRQTGLELETDKPTIPPVEGKLDQLPLQERDTWRGGPDANYPSERGEVGAGNQPTTPPTEGKLDQLSLRERDRSKEGRKEGKFDQYLKKIQDPTYLPELPTPGPKERDLSIKLLTHSDVLLPYKFAQAVAARFPPCAIFELCAVFRADLEAGKVNGIGALMHRFANAPKGPPRRLSVREKRTAYYQDLHHRLPSYETSYPR